MTPPPCTRCQQAPSSVYFPSASRCVPCFIHYLTRHFKTSLNRLPPAHRTHRITIGLSGGPCSSALALLHAHYISTLRRPPDASPPTIRLLHVLPHGHDVPPAVYIVSNAVKARVGAQLIVERVRSAVWDGTDGVKDISDRAMLRGMEVWNTILRGVATAGDHAVMVGTCVERAAADVLTAVAMGRGGEVPHLVQGGQKAGVTVVRPVVDVEMRHLIRYARELLGPEVPFLHGELRHAAGAGIGGVAERFVEEVGEGNRASVHNVVRTVGKLGRLVEGMECPACGGSVGKGGAGFEGEGEIWEGARLCGGCGRVVQRSGEGAQMVVRLMAGVDLRERVSEFLL